MNTKISFTMKTFSFTAAFALTTIFSFANGVENNMLKPTRLTFNSSTKVNKNHGSAVLTLSYDVSTFCARTNGISKPKVSEEKGFFKATRTSNGKGGLVINETTGLIDHNISDPGVYNVSYTIGVTTVSTSITVNNCN
jgi:hypothetical protein